ncbi:MAG: DUF5667 domain-containing protein [Candidatus Daviesbacteria bacterium]|nr:DUF5667 domain-containing protein [Candidatus Daviesbacteria bacterium]
MRKFTIYNLQFTIKLIFLFFTFYFLLFTFPYRASAVDDIGQSKIYPTHPLYFLKSVKEILELKFAPTSEIKAIRYLEFSQRRIREAKSLVEAKRFEMIAPTLEHYLFNLQKVMGLMDFKDEAKLRQLSETVSTHVQVLNNLYSKIESQPGQRAIRTTLFKLSQLDNPPKNLSKFQGEICDFLVKEASSSALNEVEIAVLKERASLCLQDLK